MKRFPRTLTAAVMAGALAVGGATVAQAQENQPVPGAAATPPVPGAAATPPAPGAAANPEDVKSPEGKQIPLDVTKYGNRYEYNGDGLYVNENDPEDTITVEQALDLRERGLEDQQGIPLDVTKDGNRYEYNGDGLYVNENDPKDTLTVEEARALHNGEQKPEGNDEEKPGKPDNQGSSDFDKKKLAWLALPAALIIGGIVYHLMKDGKTYTPDESRKNEDPTAEEKAASDKMLAENKDEVIAQGGQLAEGADAPATDRGIAAETGSNAAARGLAALAVVAMVAAGAFAASRKLFA